MADLEKVIKGLGCVICPNRFCSDCLYFIRNENDPDTGWCDRDAIYKDALSLLKEQEVPDTNVGKWVSVKDRLPESVANRVIVWVKDAEIYGHIGFGHYEKYKGQEIWFNLINNEAFEIRGQTVTHWMQLPEMPKEE